MLCSSKLPYGEFIRFLIVGGSGVVVNLAVFTPAVHVLHWYPLVAAVIAFAVAATWNYWWNRAWTFRWGDGGHISKYSKFVGVSLSALAINLAVLQASVSLLGWPPIAGQILGIGSGTVFNFAGSKLWVFRRGSKQAE